MHTTLRAVASVCAFFCLQAPLEAQSPIKIGFIAELSGPQGALGQDQYDAFMMVVERNGGKLGGVPVQVLREDSQLKPEVATQIVQKLLEREKVPIITGVTFSTVLAAIYRPIAEKEVFLILSNGAPSFVAGAQCSPFRYVTSWQNEQQAEVVGRYASDKGYKRMVLMTANFQGGRDYITGFKRQYKGQVLEEFYTPLDQQDFSAELTQVASLNPDAVYVFYPGGLGINFVRQYQQLGLKERFPLLSASTTDGITLQAQREAALGVISGSFWGPDFDNAESKRFVQEFEARFKRIPSQYAAQSYDAALLLDSAIAKVKGDVSDKKAFASALKQGDFKSVRGKFVFNNNNFPIQDMHAFQVAKDERGRVSLKTVATPLKDHKDPYHAECPLKD
jgi:branched-chain amino acid transport system substrate-binding protein